MDMSDDQRFEKIIDLTNSEKTSANQEMIERVTRILFVIFMPDGESMSDDQINELLDECFDMASIVMAVMGMNIVGENTNGEYVARFTPYRSLEHFAQENKIK